MNFHLGRSDRADAPRGTFHPALSPRTRPRGSRLRGKRAGADGTDLTGRIVRHLRATPKNCRSEWPQCVEPDIHGRIAERRLRPNSPWCLTVCASQRTLWRRMNVRPLSESADRAASGRLWVLNDAKLPVGSRPPRPLNTTRPTPESRRTCDFIVEGEWDVGARGALIMSFFGAVFAAMTMFWQWDVTGLRLTLPFVIFAVIGLAASIVIHLPGEGIKLSQKMARAIMWSSAGEGIGLFLASNIVINVHRPDLLLSAMALVVGLHFLPIASATSFRPFYILGTALIVCALIGVVVGAPTGGVLAGFSAACGLWIAAAMAVRRDWRSKQKAPARG